jgi:hypothetical protein
MPTNLPWRVAKNSGAIYDRDGVLVCEASPEDAAAIVEAMNLRAACEVLETAVQERYDIDARGSVLIDDRFIRDTLKWGEVAYGPLADALIALAGEVER